MFSDAMSTSVSSPQNPIFNIENEPFNLAQVTAQPTGGLEPPTGPGEGCEPDQIQKTITFAINAMFAARGMMQEYTFNRLNLADSATRQKIDQLAKDTQAANQALENQGSDQCPDLIKSLLSLGKDSHYFQDLRARLQRAGEQAGELEKAAKDAAQGTITNEQLNQIIETFMNTMGEYYTWLASLAASGALGVLKFMFPALNEATP
jgi:hypothetical protein